MNTDDMIRANLERIKRERSGDRSLLGFPVIERDALEDELTRRYYESFTNRLIVSVDPAVPGEYRFVAAKITIEVEGDTSVCLADVLRDSGILTEEEEDRITAEENQREIDASRAELRKIMKNG